MGITVKQVMEVMETIAPSSLAETWDNIGLQVGHRAWPVHKIWVALEASVKLVTEASVQGVTLLITHHPLIYHPLSTVDLQTPVGKIIGIALQKQVAVFCAHTDLDSAIGGVNDVLADNVGLRDTIILRAKSPDLCREAIDDRKSSEGLGRIGNLDEEMPLENLAQSIKEALRLKQIKIVGDPRQKIKRVAVCSGSGKSLMQDFLASDAHVYVSGDLGYHEGRNIEALGRALIDVGHFASEHLMVQSLAGRLKEALKERDYVVQLEAYTKETDCFQYI